MIKILTDEVLLKDYGLTVPKLASKTGISYSLMLKYFKPIGSYGVVLPSLPKCRAIAKALKESLDDIGFMAEHDC